MMYVPTRDNLTTDTDIGRSQLRHKRHFEIAVTDLIKKFVFTIQQSVVVVHFIDSNLLYKRC